MRQPYSSELRCHSTHRRAEQGALRHVAGTIGKAFVALELVPFSGAAPTAPPAIGCTETFHQLGAFQ